MRRGFAGLTVEERKRVAAMGGTAAHAGGKAHQFTSEQAKAAGAKSLEVRRAKARQAARDAGKKVPSDDEGHDCLDQLD